MPDGPVFERVAAMPLRCVALVGLAMALVATVLDAPVARWAATASPALVRFGLRVSGFGLSGYMLVASALLVAGALAARARGMRRLFGCDPIDLCERACFFFVAVATTGILAQVVKHLVGRARPLSIEALGAFHLDGPTSSRFALASFPSGHATTVFAAALTLGFMAPRARPVLFAAALIVAASRVLVGAHYVSDVVAGAALGAGVTLALARVFARRGLAFASPETLRPIERIGGETVCA